jgi:hypothetical protein
MHDRPTAVVHPDSTAELALVAGNANVDLSDVEVTESDAVPVGVVVLTVPGFGPTRGPIDTLIPGAWR